jgi:ABC-type polysaccharide/polyol phosphate transport system ATPase subunit
VRCRRRRRRVGECCQLTGALLGWKLKLVSSCEKTLAIMASEQRFDGRRIEGPIPAPPVIIAEGVGKRYLIYDKPGDKIRELLPWSNKTYHREFWALRDTSFRMAPGESLGVIGENGAGKSTLLRILAGTTTASDGTVSVRGIVGALLDLGTGFHPDYSGRDNVYLSGAIMGFSRAGMAAQMAEIIEFSGLQDFIDQPVKTYSSGMHVHLVFSVATAIDSDVLIIDEVLAVGDERFQRKCIARIEQFLEKQKTMVLCSHATYIIKKLCRRAIWLDHGTIKASGRASDVCDEYQDFVRQKEGEDGAAQLAAQARTTRDTDGVPVELVEACICDEQGRERDLFSVGETIRVRMVADLTSSRTCSPCRSSGDVSLLWSTRMCAARWCRP